MLSTFHYRGNLKGIQSRTKKLLSLSRTFEVDGATNWQKMLEIVDLDTSSGQNCETCLIHVIYHNLDCLHLVMVIASCAIGRKKARGLEI